MAKRPSNTIINAVLLLVVGLSIYLLGSFFLTAFNNDGPNTTEEIAEPN